MAQNRFLVTGATGDTGGYTVEQLLERGHAVRALAHRAFGLASYSAGPLLSLILSISRMMPWNFIRISTCRPSDAVTA